MAVIGDNIVSLTVNGAIEEFIILFIIFNHINSGFNLNHLNGTKESIGIRIPDYPFFQKILGLVDFPVAQTSANVSGEPALTEIEKVLRSFQDQTEKPDIIVDAGDLPEAKPSTVVDLAKNPPLVLREGEISKKDFLESLN